MDLDKVVNGVSIAFRDAPWMALIILEAGFCSGFCIAPQWVATAGHCLVNATVATVLGGMERVESDEWVWKDSTDALFVMEDGSDIGLIRLSSNECAAHLTWDHDRYKALEMPGTHLRVAGYGDDMDLGNGIVENPDYLLLRRGNVVVLDPEPFDYMVQLNTTTMMLADGSETRDPVTDTCRGDSGGPMYNAKGLVVGITSWGIGCGHAQFPGVYTKMSQCISWIRSILKESS